MDDVENAILQTLPTVGVSLGWDAIKAQLDFRQQTLMSRAIKNLEQRGLVKRVVDGTVTPPTFVVRREG